MTGIQAIDKIAAYLKSEDPRYRRLAQVPSLPLPPAPPSVLEPEIPPVHLRNLGVTVGTTGATIDPEQLRQMYRAYMGQEPVVAAVGGK